MVVSINSLMIIPLLYSAQAISAQEDLEKTKEELKTVMTAPVPAGSSAENEHDEHDESSAEASAELSNDGVPHPHDEEDRLTEAQKNERVKKQLQVSPSPHVYDLEINYSFSYSPVLHHFFNICKHTVVMILTGPELRVSAGPGRLQEDAERHAACRERQGWPRQIQDVAPDPPGKHQATN